jgi:hypothetical protein
MVCAPQRRAQDRVQGSGATHPRASLEGPYSGDSRSGGRSNTVEGPARMAQDFFQCPRPHP